jgi:hypothetical protein
MGKQVDWWLQIFPVKKHLATLPKASVSDNYTFYMSNDFLQTSPYKYEKIYLDHFSQKVDLVFSLKFKK